MPHPQPCSPWTAPARALVSAPGGWGQSAPQRLGFTFLGGGDLPLVWPSCPLSPSPLSMRGSILWALGAVFPASSPDLKVGTCQVPKRFPCLSAVEFSGHCPLRVGVAQSWGYRRASWGNTGEQSDMEMPRVGRKGALGKGNSVCQGTEVRKRGVVGWIPAWQGLKCRYKAQTGS